MEQNQNKLDLDETFPIHTLIDTSANRRKAALVQKVSKFDVVSKKLQKKIFCPLTVRSYIEKNQQFLRYCFQIVFASCLYKKTLPHKI